MESSFVGVMLVAVGAPELLEEGIFRDLYTWTRRRVGSLLRYSPAVVLQGEAN